MRSLFLLRTDDVVQLFPPDGASFGGRNDGRGGGGRRADDDRPMRSSSYEYEYNINKNTNTTSTVRVRVTLLGPLLRFYILL